jgi:hypothetical protein
VNRLLLIIIFLFSFLIGHTQSGYLFIKKGIHKKRTYTEGDELMLQLQNGFIMKGTITTLRNDTIFLNGRPVPIANVKVVIVSTRAKKEFHTSAKEILLLTGVAALVTAGITLSDQAEIKEAAIAGVVIGYSPLLIRYVGSKLSFKRKKFVIGKKFRLQILDFYLTPGPGF